MAALSYVPLGAGSLKADSSSSVEAVPPLAAGAGSGEEYEYTAPSGPADRGGGEGLGGIEQEC